MALQYLRQLSDVQRNDRANRHLGYSLAFIAGAMNAGGFLAVGQYTSHMTGIVSAMADHLVLGQLLLAATGLVAMLAFLAGAATTAIQINWARRRKLRSQFALSLMLEAFLLLAFGTLGSMLAGWDDFLAPATVFLLCYIMGLQNAIITKISHSVIRTTHVTGLVTDLGIELGKVFYYNRHPEWGEVRANRSKLILLTGLLAAFFLGGVLGAFGFKWVGYIATVPLALWLLLMAALPVLDDLRLQWWLYQHSRKTPQ